MSSTSGPAQPAGSSATVDYWMAHRDHLFLASCIALITTAMSFAIRGALIQPLGEQFGLNNEQIGWVLGTAFWGFTLAMVIGGPLCDVIGMGRLLILAFIGHLIGIVGTIFASDFWSLFLSTLSFGLANGFVEAACNPLIATLYPDQKIKRLNLFHVWFPGGIVIGGLVAYAISEAGIGGEAGGWKIQMASMLLPLILYGILFLGRKFPVTERVASGVSTGTMFKECLRPGFLLFVLCMLMTAATELGTTQWLPNILSFTTGAPGILYLVWITGLMAVGRAFAGPVVHHLSPIAMLIGSSLFSIIGLFLLATSTSAVMASVAATIFAVGVCFFWPTMLGVVSERFPKTGALGLAIMGGAGMLSTSVFLPLIGARYDAVKNQIIQAAGATEKALQAAPAGSPEAAQYTEALARGGAAGLQLMVVLPIVLAVIFTAIYFYDKSRGGYRKEVLEQDQQVSVAENMV